jgi:uncharacterized protein (DUF1015 family)
LAEIRPFRALHYADADLSALVCPPFDVISPGEQRRLYERSPFNAVRLEYGEMRADDTPSSNRYTRAAATLREWTESGVLLRDDAPALYVDDQQFTHDGQLLTRRSLFARVRLHDWNEGPVRPHEYTLNSPKEDRLQLLRACRLNISPILSLYRDGDAKLKDALETACGEAVLVASAETDGERHTVHRIVDEPALERLKSLLREKAFYVIDGHHRYETALAYREERRSRLTGDEAENFVLMALIGREDPGVVVLPTHRLLHGMSLPAGFVGLLKRDFVIEDVSASVRKDGWRAMQLSLSEAAKGAVAFGLTMNDGRHLILRVRDDAGIARHMPAGCPASWRSLDAAVVEALVLRGVLGIDQQSAAADGSLMFTHDGDEALHLVDSGDCAVAFLMSPAPVEQVLSMADHGERMPQKSTYFYPKMPAGLIMNPLEL